MKKGYNLEAWFLPKTGKIISFPFTGTVTSSLVNATMNDLNDNEAYMAIVTGALEAMLTNYDKRIRPGYGGKPKIKNCLQTLFRMVSFL